MKAEKVKANSTVTATWNEDNTVLTLDVKGAGAAVFEIEKAVHLVDRATCHGFEQRLRDRAAMSADTKTGLSASAADKLARIQALVDHYHGGGEWEMRSGGGGSKKTEQTWILEALAAVQGVTVEVMAVRVEKMAEKRGITVKVYLGKAAQNEAVMKKIAELKFGDVEAIVDLDELNGEEEGEDDSTEALV